MGVGIGYIPATSVAYYPLARSPTHVYSIPVGFGGDARGGMRTWAAEEVQKLRSQGLANSDVRLIARSLQLAGQEWLSQTARMTKFWNRLTGRDWRYYYNVGVAGQAAAPYVDMKNGCAYSTEDPTVFDGRTLFASALEHAVLDQLNGVSYPSVSTVKLLEIANTAGHEVYYANSSNYNTVKNNLVNYTEAQKASFQTAVDAGRVLLLPKNASLALNSWSGCGYIEFGPKDDENVVTSMAISGGMNGGYGTVDNVVQSAAYVAGVGATTLSANAAVPETLQADPVSMPSGAYADSRTDLVLHGRTPLAWTRRYDSRGRHVDGALGRGWSHNYDVSITECADPDAVFGRGSVEAAIPTVVAMTIVDDLLRERSGMSASLRAKRWMTAALVVQWWTDYLTSATVSVNLGTKSLLFQRKTDGTFAPCPGVTATLAKSGSLYTLQERLGSTYGFNANKLLSTITDQSGNVITLGYNGLKRLTSVQNSFGQRLSLSWTNGRITQVADGSGRNVHYTYNAAGCLTRTTDPCLKNWTATYDAETFALLSQTNPDGVRTIKNTYNDFGQVTNQISAGGETWTFGYASSVSAWDNDPKGNRLEQTYSDEGRVVRRVERNGATSLFHYDGNGHLLARRDDYGRVDYFRYDKDGNLTHSKEGKNLVVRETDFVYDAESRLVATTNALGGVTEFEYDDCNRVLKRENPDGTCLRNTWNDKGLLTSEKFHSKSGELIRETTFTYNNVGLVLAKTTRGRGLPSAGIAASYTYTASGLPQSVTDADGRTTTFTHDSCGRLLSETDPAGNATTRSYTSSGRLDEITDALSRPTKHLWTPSGKLASLVHPDGTRTTNVYDSVDRLAARRDARGALTTYLRDELGNVLSRRTATGTETNTYDALGHLTSTTDGAGVRTRFRYDWLYRPYITQNAFSNEWRTTYNPLGQAVEETDPLDRTRRTEYDTMGRRTATVKPSGARNQFGYDDGGNWTSHTNAEGHAYTMAYDALGRMTAATDAAGRQVVSNVYDGVGNLLARTDGNGVTLSCTYDACDRLTGRTGPGVADAFAHDAVGNLLAAANDTASENFSYDARDRLTAATTTVGGHAFTTFWARDAGGLVTNVASGAGWSVTRTYDADGRLVGVTDGLGHTWTFTHDGAGKPTGGTSPDGTIHAFAYDAAGRLSGWSVGTIAGRTITRDAAGRRIRDTVTAGTMPRASADRHAENVFDAADRIVSATITYGVTNTPVAEFYLHDGNGALTNVVTAGANTFEAAYTAQGQLATLGARTFAYDALGNRVVAAGRIWIPDHDDPLKRPLLECAADGTVLRRYVWGNGRLLGFVDAAGTLTIAHGDEQGSVIALTDLDGNVLHTAHYGPHGEDWGTTGVNPTPFAWLGGHGVKRLPAYGTLAPLYLTRHRLYSATLNRFLSSDPLGLSGGLNLYAYAEGTPLAYIDPLGLCAENAAGGSVLDVLQGGLDVIGVFDPTPIADGINVLISLGRDNAEDAAVSALSLIPYVGDIAKVGKYGAKAVKAADEVYDAEKLVTRSSGAIIKTSTEARAIAKANGWTEVKGVKSKGEAVFTDGKRYYSRDNMSHKGGPWKEVDAHGKRKFTLDAGLRRIDK